jgi:hypothetical protein
MYYVGTYRKEEEERKDKEKIKETEKRRIRKIYGEGERGTVENKGANFKRVRNLWIFSDSIGNDQTFRACLVTYLGVLINMNN